MRTSSRVLQGRRTELLALVIEAYERTKVEPVSPDPIDAILFRMDQMNLGKKDMVAYLGSLPKVSEVLARKRPLSLAMIRKVHKSLGIPAEILLGEGDDDIDLRQEPQYDYSKFPWQENDRARSSGKGTPSRRFVKGQGTRYR